MEPYRERIEDFIRRYGGDRVLRVLVVAVAVLLALLLVRRALRVLSVVVPALIGAVLVAAWLLLGPLSMPRDTQTSVDRSEFVWACERKVPVEPQDIARGMRKDCGIYGPQAARTSGD